MDHSLPLNEKTFTFLGSVKMGETFTEVNCNFNTGLLIMLITITMHVMIMVIMMMIMVIMMMIMVIMMMII